MFRRGKTYYFRNPLTGLRESSGTSDKGRAAAKLRDLENEAHDRKNGRYVERWEEAAERWMGLHQHLAGIKKNEDYHAFWLPHLTGMKLPEIDEQYVHRVIIEERAGRNAVNLKERTSANSTANLYVAFVAKVMRFGKVAPPAFYKYPASRKSKTWLRAEDWPRLQAKMADDLRWIITYGLASGFRIQNLIDFQWGWLHAGDTRTFLPAELTKTAQPYGIPNNATAQAIFAEIRRQPVRHATHVFTHLGQPWNYKTLLKALKRACTRAGVPVLTPHGLRHTFRSWLAQEGVSDSVARRLGCWQLGAGADKAYLHFDVERLRRFSEALDPMLCPKTVPPGAEKAG